MMCVCVCVRVFVCAKSLKQLCKSWISRNFKRVFRCLEIAKQIQPSPPRQKQQLRAIFQESKVPFISIHSNSSSASINPSAVMAVLAPAQCSASSSRSGSRDPRLPP